MRWCRLTCDIGLGWVILSFLGVLFCGVGRLWYLHCHTTQLTVERPAIVLYDDDWSYVKNMSFDVIDGRVYSSERIYVCPFCGHEFGLKATREKHITIKHSGK